MVHVARQLQAARCHPEFVVCFKHSLLWPQARRDLGSCADSNHIAELQCCRDSFGGGEQNRCRGHLETVLRRSSDQVLMIVGPITVRSACSHHLVPILGKLWVGILPNEKTNLIGLSKYSRIAEWIMSRPQIQEEAVMQLADELERRMRPDGLALVLEADHFCMQWRGVKDESHMTNSIMRGAFLVNPELRGEFLQLVKP
jgi:GTP cyclohydrolase I